MSRLFSLKNQKINYNAPLERKYTEVLGSIALMPKMLYFYGKMPAKRVKTVAIVGSRKPTRYGEKIAYDLAYAVAEKGGIVISGLAYGIDSCAHRGALAAGGVTIAVLGTPIDEIYPRAREGLAAEIVQTGGAIISEYAPGTYQSGIDRKKCFLERNRIISGLADVVVVPEAAERSGSLNTAAHALEQGKEIFAAPGNITSPLSAGTNALIAKGGAGVYTRPEDVLELLWPVPKRRRTRSPDQAAIFGDTEAETAILKLLAAGVQEGEQIMTISELNVSEFNQTMTILEIKGRVSSLGANRWALR